MLFMGLFFRHTDSNKSIINGAFSYPHATKIVFLGNLFGIDSYFPVFYLLIHRNLLFSHFSSIHTGKHDFTAGWRRKIPESINSPCLLLRIWGSFAYLCMQYFTAFQASKNNCHLGLCTQSWQKLKNFIQFTTRYTNKKLNSFML